MTSQITYPVQKYKQVHTIWTITITSVPFADIESTEMVVRERTHI